MRARGNRGFSLLEMVVVLGLTVLLLAVISSVVLPLTREVLRAYEEIDTQRTAVRLAGSWGRDLESARPQSVNLGGPSVWVVRRLEDALVGDRAAYRAGLVFYRWDRERGTLRRGILATGSAPLLDPALPAADRWMTLLAGLREDRWLAGGVGSLDCQTSGTGATVRVTLRRELSGRTLESRWEQTFRWRN